MKEKTKAQQIESQRTETLTGNKLDREARARPKIVDEEKLIQNNIAVEDKRGRTCVK